MWGGRFRWRGLSLPGGRRCRVHRGSDHRALLDKTLERIANGAFENRSLLWDLVSRAASLEGIESVLRRIIQRPDDQISDHMAEIKYGVLFKDCDFRVKFEPTGSKGPDLLVTRDEMSAFVEVKRYRPKVGEELPQEWGPDGTFLSYGDPFNAQCAFETDLTRKLQQIKLPIGIQHAILAVWSDRECFEEIEFEAAVRAISIEAAKKGFDFACTGRFGLIQNAWRSAWQTTSSPGWMISNKAGGPATAPRKTTV